MRQYAVLILLALLSFRAYAQNEKSEFKGLALDMDTNEPVAFATIRVLNRNKGMATTETGFFNFKAQIGDEVKISSIGYHDYLFIITQEHLELEEPFKAYLMPKTYVLDSIEVIQMTENFYLKRPKWDTLDINNPYLNKTDPTDWEKVNVIPHSNIEETKGLAGFTISGFLNSFDKDLQQKKYLERFKKADLFRAERKAELDKKFNKEMVKEITDIDDRVIDEFMTFCNFRDGEILRATEYEMTVMILDRYKQFLLR